VAQAEQRFLNEQEWRRFSVKTGTKGPLLFEWACLPILHRWEDDGQHWLLIRRIPTHPTEKTYYLVFGPAGTSLAVMAWAVGSRWGIEEEFENAKDLGLDQYEVRSWVGWFRHVTLVLLVLAVVTVLCAQERAGSPTSRGRDVWSAHSIPHPADRPRGAPSAGSPPFPPASQRDDRVGLVLVAPRPSGEGTRLARKTAPELELGARSLNPFSLPGRLLTASRATLVTSASSWLWGALPVVPAFSREVSL
jgi:hypothetical protein